ncbi:hypothetical protein [Oceanibaculum pacificum]|uniref:Uncharacterized protein n=1 Tax=Oceanibaculum pacificum TaxID=580166 RepID=A0A154VYX9_9PROT|nr:hypothetical protein [Oceanibaculum pacificum]KZD06448.1 hypothetical protein AUP43_10675 [Oceanibaculum pacificum]
MQILADSIGQLTVANGVLRVQLIQTGPDGQPREAGVLTIPAAQAAPFANQLARGVTELADKVKSRQEETMAEAAMKKLAN